MKKFLKYLGWICLGGLAMTLTLCSVGVYQVTQTINRTIAGADNYTCRQFMYDSDIRNTETDRLPALMIAAFAYGRGTSETTVTADKKQYSVMEDGMERAVRKVYALCKGNPSERVVNLFTADVTGATTVSNTTPTNAKNTVSGTTPVSPTLNAEH